MNVTLFDIAQRFVGVEEVPGQRDNAQILAMLRLDDAWPEHDEVPWCSGFMNYVAWLLRLPRSKSLAARSWLDVGRPIPLHQAYVGFDVVVLYRGARHGPSGHVGLYAGIGREEEQVLLLGGNQGNMVSVAPYPEERVIGVRRLHEGGR